MVMYLAIRQRLALAPVAGVSDSAGRAAREEDQVSIAQETFWARPVPRPFDPWQKPWIVYPETFRDKEVCRFFWHAGGISLSRYDENVQDFALGVISSCSLKKLSLIHISEPTRPY